MAEERAIYQTDLSSPTDDEFYQKFRAKMGPHYEKAENKQQFVSDMVARQPKSSPYWERLLDELANEKILANSSCTLEERKADGCTYAPVEIDALRIALDDKAKECEEMKRLLDIEKQKYADASIKVMELERSLEACKSANSNPSQKTPSRSLLAKKAVAMEAYRKLLASANAESKLVVEDDESDEAI